MKTSLDLYGMSAHKRIFENLGLIGKVAKFKMNTCKFIASGIQANVWIKQIFFNLNNL